MTIKETKTSSQRCLPWNDLMAFAFGQLKIPPDQFWSCTLIELKATIEGVYGGVGFEAPSKDVLNLMMGQFPDGGTLNQEDVQEKE